MSRRFRWISMEERLTEPRYLVALKSECVKTLAYESKPLINGLFRDGCHETANHHRKRIADINKTIKENKS